MKDIQELQGHNIVEVETYEYPLESRIKTHKLPIVKISVHTQTLPSTL